MKMDDSSSAVGSIVSDEDSGCINRQDNDKVSTSDTSTHGDSSNGNTPGKPFTLAQNESRLVARSKMVVLLILIIAAALVGMATYLHTSKEEERRFEQQFEEYANEVADISALNALHVFDIYKSFARHMEVFAIGTGSSWPFVTVPRFQSLAREAMTESNSEMMVALHPLITESQRDAWESYSVANQEWIKEGFEYDGLHKYPAICPFIHTGNTSVCSREADTSDTFYTPVWEVSPVRKYYNWVNFDTMGWAYFNRAFQRMLKENGGVLSEVTNLNTTRAQRSAVVSEVTNLEENATKWPESFLVQPIHNDTQGSTVLVAVLSAVLPWHNYFTHLLPEGLGGIHIVVTNTCEQQFTYEAIGPNALYLGIGDLHDTKYDHLERAEEFDLWKLQECKYTLHVYPSDEFRSSFVDRNPLIYTCAVLGVFLLTAVSFIVYDCFVEMRQEKVMTTAENTNTIVRSVHS